MSEARQRQSLGSCAATNLFPSLEDQDRLSRLGKNNCGSQTIWPRTNDHAIVFAPVGQCEPDLIPASVRLAMPASFLGPQSIDL